MQIINKLAIGLMPMVPKSLVGKVASPYIAGAKLSDAIAEVRKLNSEGAVATIDLLGEFSTNPDHAHEATQTYIEILEAIDREKLDSNISLKPTHMGLRIGYDFCREQVETILSKATELGNFLRIDMEDHPCTDDTFRLYNELHEKYGNAGVVIQAYLHRTIEDIKPLMQLKANIRLCKGIYNEPRTISYKNRTVIINNYALLLEELLKAGCYVGIATHCEETVWHARRIIHQLNLRRDQYEFQMLLGVDPMLRRILIDEGHKLRVYVPFGEEWYPYSTRRLKENPAIAGYAIREFFRQDKQNGRG